MLAFMEDHGIPMKYRPWMLGKRSSCFHDPPLVSSSTFQKMKSQPRNNHQNGSSHLPTSRIETRSSTSTSTSSLSKLHPTYLQKLHRLVHHLLYDPEHPWSTSWHIQKINILPHKGHVQVYWKSSQDPTMHLSLDNPTPPSSIDELKEIGSHFKAQLKKHLKLPRHLVPLITFHYQNTQLDFFMHLIEQENSTKPIETEEKKS
ncbi:hypothetical protein HMI54_013383 [Coelomomyces lativittatus]|nr:hypothetical protein HMI54_013383 [Coelomomyces lativittatus]KAJ1502021.1 hypothetical protein HMI56_002913 [Coelomomyces lativittatus]